MHIELTEDQLKLIEKYGEINPPHHTAEEIEEALKKLSEIGIELHEI